MAEEIRLDITFDQLNLVQQIQLLKETCRLFKQNDDPEMFKQLLSMVEGIQLPEIMPGFNSIEGVA